MKQHDSAVTAVEAPRRRSGTSAEERDQSRRGSMALDQWRGLALVLVLISHGFYFTNRVHGIGRVGVNLFFFISGILVFRSLSKIREATPGERSRAFWWHRLRRLYPALIAYLIAMLGGSLFLQRLHNLPPNSDFASYLRMLPFASTYLINYCEGEPRALGHLWSIACEMQFYMLAPLIYLLGGQTDRRRILVFFCLLAILMFTGLLQPLIGKWKYHFEFAVWPMMLGFCCEYRRDWFKRLAARLVTVVLWLSTIVCGASLCLMLFGIEMKTVVIATGALLLAPCLLAYLFGRQMSGRFGAGMAWIGERTYSVYLWQQPLTICEFLPQVFHPLGAIIAVPAGGIWFRLFEAPFLSRGRREQITRSS